MTIPGSASPLLLRTAADGGYAIERSLRFNSSDSAYLSRTPASAGNRKTWTWAGWVKRSGLGANSGLFETSGSPRSDANSFSLYFADGGFGTVNNALVIARNSFYHLITAQVFRDVSAWYHIVLAADTVQATASNRLKLYVNGSQITSFGSATYPSLNEDLPINAAVSHSVGRHAGSSYLSGYLADIHFIDGQALDPTSFGEFDATTGVWVPIEYTGSYGTNGFQLDFADNSSNTATTLGKDTAGSNNWTPNNLSVTAGAGNDSLVDVPTNGAETDTGVGGEVRGNYCTLNPLDTSGFTLSNGNLDWSHTAGGWTLSRSTIGITSGKWYAEMVRLTGDYSHFGVSKSTASLTNYLGSDASGWAYSQDGNKYTGGSSSSYGASFTNNDVIGIAFDADNGTLAFYKNGVSQGTAYTGLTSGPYFFSFSSFSTSQTGVVNFGQRPFAYTAPSGFKALNTANLPAPVVTKPSTVFDTTLYTGNNTARSITGLGFSPDFVWIKGRSGATDHALYDIVRGAQLDLVSNSTAAETTQTTGLTAFNSDGFSIGTLAKLNTNAATYAAWAWDAGSSTVTNTQGSISSQVRANASAGFSVVTFTKNNGSSNSATFGHGLNATPHLIITKARNLTEPWYTYHHVLGNNGRVQLNETSAATIGTSVWGTTSPTSQVFTMQGVFDGNYVAYCFAPVAGYSAFGSYTGNGSADGPFVYTGFRPRWVLVKAIDATDSWWLFDSARNPYNLTDLVLRTNVSNAEAQAQAAVVDLVSNGFKMRGTSVTNASGVNFIYAAFAEHPFQYARAR
jgi:hypothetical protein